ncbi:MAG: hypothetical protein K8W52_21010 [Deltaproteobacteria bacterium]|nr:hypothetical protein [Deltaproteobacteria bacterium]
MKYAGFALVIALSACGERTVSTVVPDDTAATLALGRAALHGQPRDLPRARAYFARAAQDGSGAAAYYLGVLAERDPAERIRWLTIAAERGEPHAMFLLGNAYRSGAGVPRDDARALAYYAQAAEAELPAALQTLAMAYRSGELGLAPDEDEARRYEMEAGHALDHPPPEP